MEAAELSGKSVQLGETLCIARYVDVSNPEIFTGHYFRRSSASLLVVAGADICGLDDQHFRSSLDIIPLQDYILPLTSTLGASPPHALPQMKAYPLLYDPYPCSTIFARVLPV
ncbi:hypothetical protein ANN_11414 [Periplaneta americana]|uniref:Uncharacterized protein n=1 Tax=Periplaneta americana TaxID=6978 RepID=A0ABQ8T6H8_PERAM|nr:hypothetical protein ANN_11414 [Periplaneta americana]